MAPVNSADVDVAGADGARKPQPLPRQSGGIPDWLAVTLALVVIFVLLPMLTPVLWVLYRLLN
jgi:hypothetical protein